MIDWLVLIVSLAVVNYLSNINIGKNNYSVLFWFVFLVAVVSNIMISYEIISVEFLNKFIAAASVVDFGSPLSWEIKSNTDAGSIVACYYISLLSVISVVLISCSYEHSYLQKQRDVGKKKNILMATISMGVLYWMFYSEMSLSSVFSGKTLKYMFGTKLGILGLTIILILVARDIGKILRVCFEVKKSGIICTRSD